jgi:hypothetical protein
LSATGSAINIDLKEKGTFLPTGALVFSGVLTIAFRNGILYAKEEKAMLLKTQAATEVAQFLARHPTSEQIVAFHPSPEIARRAYELIQLDRDGSLNNEERQELDSYMLIEYLMDLIKLEARRQLRQQAS